MPLIVERALENDNHEVATVRNRCPGASDVAVIELANAEDRVLITYDRDFGTQIFHNAIRPAPTTVYVRTIATSPSADATRILEALRNVDLGAFHVIDAEGMRKRAIGSSRQG